MSSENLTSTASEELDAPGSGTATIIDVPGQGRLRANSLGGNVVEALAIPFAQPPIGELRFRPPRAPHPWAQKTLDATRLGPGCMQDEPSYPVSEDCLQLNIWAPSAALTAKAQRKAVLVWAFGGGLTSGSGRTFNGTALTQLGDIVVVTVNYRLGALGFYASAAQAAEEPFATGGLNGVLDILQALKFVHEHITAFGGDPTRIALAGESSGAVSSCMLAFSPLARGLFHRLTLESGACTGPWFGPDPSRAGSFAASAAFADGTGCTGGNGTDEGRLACMRGLDASTLVATQHWDDLNFGIDGYLLSAAPSNLTLQCVLRALLPALLLICALIIAHSCPRTQRSPRAHSHPHLHPHPVTDPRPSPSVTTGRGCLVATPRIPLARRPMRRPPSQWTCDHCVQIWARTFMRMRRACLMRTCAQQASYLYLATTLCSTACSSMRAACG